MNSIIKASPYMEALNVSDYITLNNNITVNNTKLFRISEHLVSYSLDARLNFSVGETVIGHSTYKVDNSGSAGKYLAGRATCTSGVLPLTAIIIGGGGEFRIYSMESGTSFALQGLIVVRN